MILTKYSTKNELKFPKAGLVLGLKGRTNFCKIKSDSEKKCITDVFTISAKGQIYHSMTVFPSLHIPAEVVSNTNPDWIISKTTLTIVIPNFNYVFFSKKIRKVLEDKPNILQLRVLYFATAFEPESY